MRGYDREIAESMKFLRDLPVFARNDTSIVKGARDGRREMKSRNFLCSGRNVSKIRLLWMKTGQSSPANLLPGSPIEPAPYMLKNQHDEQNVIAGSDAELADLWSCRQIARDV